MARAVAGVIGILALVVGALTVASAPANAAPGERAGASQAAEAKAKWRKVKKFCGKDTCAWGKLRWTKTGRTKKEVEVKIHADMRGGGARARTEMKWIVDYGPDTDWGMAVGPCSSCHRGFISNLRDPTGIKTIRGVKFRTCYLKESGKYVNCKSTVTYGP